MSFLGSDSEVINRIDIQIDILFSFKKKKKHSLCHSLITTNRGRAGGNHNRTIQKASWNILVFPFSRSLFKNEEHERKRFFHFYLSPLCSHPASQSSLSPPTPKTLLLPGLDTLHSFSLGKLQFIHIMLKVMLMMLMYKCICQPWWHICPRFFTRIELTLVYVHQHLYFLYFPALWLHFYVFNYPSNKPGKLPTLLLLFFSHTQASDILLD